MHLRKATRHLLASYACVTMSQSDNWPSDADDCESHLTSDGEVFQDVSTAPRSRLRPAEKAPATLLYDCQTSDEDGRMTRKS